MLIGVDDDIDMRGINPAWYGRVPSDAQRRLIAVFPEARFVWCNVTRQWAVLQRIPGIVVRFNDGTLDGWIIGNRFPAGLPFNGIIQNMRAIDRRRLAEQEKDSKKRGDVRTGGTLDLEAQMAEHDAAKERAADKELEDMVKDAMPDGKRRISVAGDKAGPQEMSEIFKRDEARELDAISKVHSREKSRPIFFAMRPPMLVPQKDLVL